MLFKLNGWHRGRRGSFHGCDTGSRHSPDTGLRPPARRSLKRDNPLSYLKLQHAAAPRAHAACHCHAPVTACCPFRRFSLPEYGNESIYFPVNQALDADGQRIRSGSAVFFILHSAKNSDAPAGRLDRVGRSEAISRSAACDSLCNRPETKRFRFLHKIATGCLVCYKWPIRYSDPAAIPAPFRHPCFFGFTKKSEEPTPGTAG